MCTSEESYTNSSELIQDHLFSFCIVKRNGFVEHKLKKVVPEPARQLQSHEDWVDLRSVEQDREQPARPGQGFSRTQLCSLLPKASVVNPGVFSDLISIISVFQMSSRSLPQPMLNSIEISALFIKRKCIDIYFEGSIS